MTQSVICIMGPTASGKSDLALQLAERLPVEIVSVDSAQIYRGMDIGTAKPNKQTLARYPHHLIGIRDPAESYSVAEFCTDAAQAIAAIHARQKIPLLVGGTMLYFRGLQYGLSALPPADATIRQQLQSEADQLGWPALYERLKTLDPTAAARIKSTDPQRIQRALEVYQLTGKPLSEHWKSKTVLITPDKLINLALMPQDRAHLHQKITQRFGNMLEQGLIAEVGQLYQRSDLHPALSSIRSVGYRQIWQYLANEIDQTTMRETAIAATRQLAKRQLTWLRGWENKTVIESKPVAVDKVLTLLETAL